MMTDTLNEFVIKFREGVSYFNINEYKELSGINESSWITNTLGLDIANSISPQLYTSYIQKAINDLDVITVDVDELDSFFSDVYNSVTLSDKNITIPLRNDDDIEKIRPEYLSTVYAEFDSTVSKILKGDSNESKLKEKFINNEYYNKLKKQLVKTSLVINDSRDMMQLDSPPIVKIDNLFIQNNIIPFLRGFIPTVKGVRTIAIKTIGAISVLHQQISSSITSLKAMISSGKIKDQNTIRLLKYYTYNMKTVVMNLSAYISTMIIRKISYLSFNISSYMELYNIIQRYFPEMKGILHESVMNGELKDIDDTTLLNSIIDNNLSIIYPHINKAVGLKKMEIANIMSSKYNMKMDYMRGFENNVEYDTRPYSAANATIKDIAKNLSIFNENLKKPDMIADDIVEKANLTQTFSLKYTNVLTNITNIDYYSVNSPDINKSSDTLMSLFAEIFNFETNLDIITSNMSKCYNYIESIINLFEVEYTDMQPETHEELKSFVDEMMVNYKEYIVHLLRQLLSRLDSLTEMLNNNIDANEDDNNNIVTQTSSPNNYSCESYISRYNEIEYTEAVMFTSMIKEYNSIKEKSQRGVDVVYEDVEPVSNDNGKNNSTEPKVEGAPKVDTTGTNANNQDKENANNKNDTNNNTGGKSILQIFKEFIDNLIQKFKTNSAKYTAKNNKWLKSVKNDILSLDLSNTTITVAKFEGVDSGKLSTNISAAINKINGVNSSNLPSELTGERSKAELYLFPNIPEKVGDESSFGPRIKRFYIYGNTNKNELISYSGSDAKTIVNDMIEFCETYDGTYKSVLSSISKLSDAAYKKQEEIINQSKNNSNNTSDNSTNNNENSGDNKVNKSSVITSIVRDYTGSVSTVLEKKYLDYIKVLNSLAPKNKKEGDTGSSNNNQNETEQKSN